MIVITNMVSGPFKDEQEFKQAVLKVCRRDSSVSGSRTVYFEIENEEKEPGMPDALAVSRDSPACFTEFKYSDKNGVITFRKSQPLFYKQYDCLPIQILAWDVRAGGRVVAIDPDDIITAKTLRFTIPETIETSVSYPGGQRS